MSEIRPGQIRQGEVYCLISILRPVRYLRSSISAWLYLLFDRL